MFRKLYFKYLQYRANKTRKLITIFDKQDNCFRFFDGRPSIEEMRNEVEDYFAYDHGVK